MGGEEGGAGEADPLGRRPPPPRERPFAAASPRHCSLVLPLLGYSTIPLFLAVLGAGVNASALAALWFLYMAGRARGQRSWSHLLSLQVSEQSWWYLQ